MKKNIPLIVGISIPILMILFVAGSIYLPSLFVKPSYNFLYLLGASCYGQPYSVVNGKLEQNDVKYPANYNPPAQPELFIYDATKDQSQQISFADAQNLNLDSTNQSPDGFEVVSGNSGGGDYFPFYFGPSNYNDGWYLKGHNIDKKINIQTVGNYYNFTFLGWIKK
jgi:hypothetical protein